MAVGNALLDMYNEVKAEIALRESREEDKDVPPKKAPKPRAISSVGKKKILCPECGEPLAFEGGCNVCKSCGWSKCY